VGFLVAFLSVACIFLAFLYLLALRHVRRMKIVEYGLREGRRYWHDRSFFWRERKDAWRDRCETALHRERIMRRALEDSVRHEISREAEIKDLQATVFGLEKKIEKYGADRVKRGDELAELGGKLAWFRHFMSKCEGAPKEFSALVGRRFRLVEKKPRVVGRPREAV